MLNMSRMPTIIPGSHGLMRIELDFGTLSTSKPTNLGELVDLGKFGSNHVGILNTMIYLKESLPDLKRENHRFGGFRGKMVFFQDKGSILITLNI